MERPATFKQTDNHSHGRALDVHSLMLYLLTGPLFVKRRSLGLLFSIGYLMSIFRVMSVLISVYSTYSWSRESNSLTDRTGLIKNDANLLTE